MLTIEAAFNAQLARLTSEIDGPLGIAVSGGSDSRALLELTAKWASEQHIPIYALTVDHGLRPEAKMEAERVAQRCRQLGIAHDTLIWRSTAGHVSQAKSRRARHALLATAARKKGSNLILMGHTYDDQLETLAMRKGRRSVSGFDAPRQVGLAGMRALAVVPVWPEGCDVFVGRPCLALRRCELRTYLQEQGFEWIEDPSNEDQKYERVRARQMLASVSVQETETLQDQLYRAGQTRDAFSKDLADWLSAHVRADPDGLIVVDIEGLLRPELLSEALAWLLMIGAGTDRRAGRESREQLASDILSSPRQFRARTLGGAQIAPRQGSIHIAREPGGVPDLPQTMLPGDIWDGRFRWIDRRIAGALAQKMHGNMQVKDGKMQISALARASYPKITETGLQAECLLSLRLSMVKKMLRYKNIEVS